MIHTDFLIFGSGVAGLTFAIKIATHFPDKNVTIITKSNADESNTKYAQGGIAVVFDSTPQFSAMLDECLPKNVDGVKIDGVFAIFANKDKKIINLFFI